MVRSREVTVRGRTTTRKANGKIFLERLKSSKARVQTSAPFQIGLVGFHSKQQATFLGGLIKASRQKGK